MAISTHCFTSLPLPRPKYCLFFFTLFSTVPLVLLLLHREVDSISQVKTIAGHNLKPTPWHGFRLKQFDNSTGRIFRCSFLTPCTSFLHWSAIAGHQRAVAIHDPTPSPECPFVFRWIHEDLAPWAESGISAADVAAAKDHAAMRVLIVGGRLYVDLYYACVESRAVFTLWGLLQLLRRFPGEVPDVDFMFDCMDRPVIPRSLRRRSPPPPLFRYSTTPGHYDIPFPDWSFWGWYVFTNCKTVHN